MTPKILFLTLFLTLTGALSAAERVLVCLGDSLTAGLGVDEEKAYPALLQKALGQGKDPWRVVNAGISGDTSAGGLKRLDWVLRGQPEVVFVALGANDGLRGFDPKTTETNLRAILKKIKAAGAVPLLAGIDLPTNLGPTYRDAFRAIYPQVAKAEGVPLMTFLLQGVGGVAGLNQADGVHPNEAGHALIAKHVLAFLRPHLKAVPPRAGAGESAPAKVLRRRDVAGAGK
jgi:acyl-CoA thioesterase-1